MGLKGLVDKAKSTATDIKESSVDKAKSTSTRVKQSSSETALKIKDSTERIVHHSREKLAEATEALLKEMEGLIPILLECGFVVGDISLTLSMPPRFALKIVQTGRGKMSLEQILTNRADSITRTQTMFLSALIKANELAEITQKHGYVFEEYELTMTLPPQVTVHLVSDEV